MVGDVGDGRIITGVFRTMYLGAVAVQPIAKPGRA